MGELIVALRLHPCGRILAARIQADTDTLLSLVPAGKACEHAHTRVTLRVGRFSPRGGEFRPTVLVVDDEPGVRTLVRRMLADQPRRILEAGDGVEALALARHERPSVLLLDVVMPDLDGWAVLEALQADSETRAIPVVLISGHVALDQETARGRGASAVLAKPFRLAALHALMQKLPRRRDATSFDDC